MQCSPPGERDSGHDGAPLRLVASVFQASVETFQQILFRLHGRDVQRKSLPAHDIHCAEVERSLTGIVDFDEIDTPGASLVRMPALRVTGVDHCRSLFAKHLAGVDVAKRPVVDAGPDEVIQGAGRIGPVVGVIADVSVQEPDGNGSRLHFPKATNQIRLDVALRIADAVHDSACGIVLEHRDRFERRAKAVARRRKVQTRFPAIQRIVIPMADERPDAVVVQALQPFDELSLGAQAAVGSVVHVPRN